MTRAGFPAAKTSEGMSRVTTLPAPMTARSPIVTPGQMITPPPTHTSEPIVIGLADSSHLRRSTALMGCVAGYWKGRIYLANGYGPQAKITTKGWWGTVGRIEENEK